jgi:hypothetical protein
MGLLFAKFYNSRYDESKKTDVKTIHVLYGIQVYLLKSGELFQVPETDNIEVYFNDASSLVHITYDEKDSIRFSLDNKNVNFMIVEGDGPEGRTTVNYPWSDKYNALRIIQYTREEYMNDHNGILERYMEYRD